MSDTLQRPEEQAASQAEIDALAAEARRRYARWPKPNTPVALNGEHLHYDPEQVCRIGDEVYRKDIRPKVMPEHKGKFLSLDVLSGDYEVDADDMAAWERLAARQPHGVFCGKRIGYKQAYSFGSQRLQEDEE